MTRSMRADDLAAIFQADTLADGALHGRIRDAIIRLDDATVPLKARALDNDAVSGGGGHSDPVGELADKHLEHGDPVADTRDELQRLILARHHIGISIAAICNHWAPRNAPGVERPTQNLAIWCTNHLLYGEMEPRAENGSQWCEWCRSVKGRYGKLPTAELVKLKAKVGKIADGTYRRLLGKKAA